MSIKRIVAMLLRYYYSFRDPDRLAEFFIWPAIDIGIYGLIAKWIGGEAANGHLAQMLIIGLILWQITFRSHYEICFNVYDEFIEHNLTNLVATPLKVSEWSISLMLSGTYKVFLTFFYGSAVGYLFFGINVWHLGAPLLVFCALCLLGGWVIGFFAAALMIYLGLRMHQLPWIIITFAGILSAVTYPVNVLPEWMRTVALCLPMSYIFEGMRHYLTEGFLSMHYVKFSLMLSLIYLVIAMLFFKWMFEKGRKKGFQY